MRRQWLNRTETTSGEPLRLQALDGLKTLAIIWMLIMHVFPTYARPEYDGHLAYRVFFYAIEGMAAPAFMLAMGASITLSRPKGMKQVLGKGLSLILQGYLLNLLKFAPPVLIFHSFPAALFMAIGCHPGPEGLAGFLMIGDILQFAGIAYVICQALYRTGSYHRVLCALLIVLLLFVSPLTYGIDQHKAYIAGLFYGRSLLIFFPVLPWLIFPLLGMLAGSFFRRHSSTPDLTMRQLGNYGLLLFAAGLLCLIADVHRQWGEDYYRRGSGGLLLYGGVALGATVACHFLVRSFSESLQRLIRFCSSQVTRIYYIQWILIYWGTAVVGYQRLNLYQCVVALLFIALLTLWLSRLYHRFVSGRLKLFQSISFFKT